MIKKYMLSIKNHSRGPENKAFLLKEETQARVTGEPQQVSYPLHVCRPVLHQKHLNSQITYTVALVQQVHIQRAVPKIYILTLSYATDVAAFYFSCGAGVSSVLSSAPPHHSAPQRRPGQVCLGWGAGQGSCSSLLLGVVSTPPRRQTSRTYICSQRH